MRGVYGADVDGTSGHARRRGRPRGRRPGLLRSRGAGGALGRALAGKGGLHQCGGGIGRQRGAVPGDDGRGDAGGGAAHAHKVHVPQVAVQQASSVCIACRGGRGGVNVGKG